MFAQESMFQCEWMYIKIYVIKKNKKMKWVKDRRWVLPGSLENYSIYNANHPKRGARTQRYYSVHERRRIKSMPCHLSEITGRPLLFYISWKKINKHSPPSCSFINQPSHFFLSVSPLFVAAWFCGNLVRYRNVGMFLTFWCDPLPSYHVCLVIHCCEFVSHCCSLKFVFFSDPIYMDLFCYALLVCLLLVNL